MLSGVGVQVPPSAPNSENPVDESQPGFLFFNSMLKTLLCCCFYFVIACTSIML